MYSTRSAALSLFLLLLAILAAACGGGSSSSSTPVVTAPTQPTYTLQGTVSDKAASSKLLADATVLVLDGVNANASAKTDANGVYRLTGLKEGGFNVRITRRGYVTQDAQVTLTADQKLDIGLAMEVAKLSVSFANSTIVVRDNDDARYPNQLLFHLSVAEGNGVDITVQYLAFELISLDGNTSFWHFDNTQLRSRMGVDVAGGGVEGCWWNLIYDGEKAGTLGVLVQATDASGRLYSATASAQAVKASVAGSAPTLEAPVGLQPLPASSPGKRIAFPPR